MRRYETVFVLRPDLSEAQVKDTVKRFEQIVSGGGGELIETDPWGIRDLAYSIGRERRGYYVRLDYASPGAVVNDVERNLKLADDVMRFLSVMVEPDADPGKLRDEVETRNRRLAEAKAASAAAEQAAAEARAAAAQANSEPSPPADEDSGKDEEG